jgi:hypothetical protein
MRGGFPRTHAAMRKTKHPVASAFLGLGVLIFVGALWLVGIAATILAGGCLVYLLWELGRFLIG